MAWKIYLVDQVLKIGGLRGKKSQNLEGSQDFKDRIAVVKSLAKRRLDMADATNVHVNENGYTQQDTAA